MGKEKLIEKILDTLQDNFDCSGYENMVFDLVEEGLKQFNDNDLKDYLSSLVSKE